LSEIRTRSSEELPSGRGKLVPADVKPAAELPEP
jgi:hypothetical protein